MARKKVGKKPSDIDAGLRTPIRVRLRGTGEWYDWVKALADSRGQKVPEMFDELLDVAARLGGQPPPPPRT
jgi:hypothetical protein